MLIGKVNHITNMIQELKFAKLQFSEYIQFAKNNFLGKEKL